MLPGYIFFAAFIILVYSLTHENRRYTATASAIRQIWSGSCRLGCRPSGYSEGTFSSGLSGLAVPLNEVDENRHAVNCVCDNCPCALIENFLKCWNPDDIFDFSRLVEALTPDHEAIANGCTCEICPCPLIKEVIKTCRPATRLYHNTVGILFELYCTLLKKLSDAYNNMSRILQCGTSCQRHAQMVESRSYCESNENFTLVEDQKPKSDRSSASMPYSSTSGGTRRSGYESSSKYSSSTTPQVKSSASSSGTKVSNASSAIKSSGESTMASIASREQTPTIKPRSEQFKTSISDETLKPAESIAGPKKSCSKCVEKGKTCIGGCPGGKEKKRK